jgi:hypothetical protein
MQLTQVFTLQAGQPGSSAILKTFFFILQLKKCSRSPMLPIIMGYDFLHPPFYRYSMIGISYTQTKQNKVLYKMIIKFRNVGLD